MANQNLLKMLMMRNCLLGNVCCWEIVKSLSRLESNSLTFLQLVKAVVIVADVDDEDRFGNS